MDKEDQQTTHVTNDSVSEPVIDPEKTLRKSAGRLVFLLVAFLLAYGLVMALFNVSPADFIRLTSSLPLGCLLLLALRLALMLLAETLLWYCYLRHLGIRLPFPAAFSIFMAGFFTGILPGRVGELIRYYLLRRRYAIPLSKTLPIHLLFTLNAGVAAVLLALPALYLINRSKEMVISALVLLFVGLFALRTRPFRKAVLAVAARTPVLKRHLDKLEHLLESACHLTRPSVFIWALPLSLVYLVTMAAISPILISGLGLEQNILLSMAAYCVGAIGGALTLLPGGVGMFEAGTTHLLMKIGLVKDPATTIALLSSALTTWPALAVGFVCLMLNKRYLLPDSKE